MIDKTLDMKLFCIIIDLKCIRDSLDILFEGQPVVGILESGISDLENIREELKAEGL